MNARIHNRDGQMPADHWYQIEVNGTFPAGKWQDAPKPQNP